MPQIQVEQRSSSGRCPLCLEELSGGEASRTCEECSIAVHSECLLEFGGGCPTTGCGGAALSRTEPSHPQDWAQGLIEGGTISSDAHGFRTCLSNSLEVAGVLALVVGGAAWELQDRGLLGPILTAVGLALFLLGWLVKNLRVS